MKKLRLLSLCILCLCFNKYTLAQPALTITVTNVTGSSTITCNIPSISFSVASNDTSNLVTYFWNGPSTGTGSTFTAFNAGTYTVTATLGSATASKTLAVGINTAVPVSSISSSVLTAGCGTTSMPSQLLMAANPTVNITHSILSPFGGTFIASTYSTNYSTTGQGTYTYVFTNLTNGCKSIKTFTVSAPTGLPTYSLVSPQNFSLGCSTKSVAVINIVNANTTPVSGGAMSYTLLPPSSSSVTNSGSLSSISSYSVNTPGNYTVITKDNTNLCETRVPVTITLNNSGPPLDSVIIATNVLTCFTPSTTLKAISANTNVSYNWTFVGAPGSLPGNSITVVSNSASPTSTLINNYTITITDLNNLCLTTSVIPMYQNTFPPNPAISAGNNYTLTCANPTIALTNISSSGIPANSIFPRNLVVIGLLWNGPAPQPSLALSTVYTASTSGIYTLTARDQNNGCKASATVAISDGRIFPAVSAPGPFLLACLNGSVNIYPVISGSNSNLTYLWQVPLGSTVSSITGSAITVSSAGYYTVTATNTITGCATNVQVSVWACVGLSEQSGSATNLFVYPNPGKGIFSFELKNNAGNLFMEAYNSLGVLVKKQIVTEGKNTVNLENEAPGIYFIQLVKDGKKAYQAKVIKE